MKNIIKKLFCLHKWNILKSYKLIKTSHYNPDQDCYIDILTCSECGKIKKIVT